MSWLAIHIWFELLVAAAIGMLIGWALHAWRRAQAGVGATASAAMSAPTAQGAEQQARIVELETQHNMDRQEIVALHAQLADASRAMQQTASPAHVEPLLAPPAPPPTSDEDASLAWRNRYLESRIRFLEGKLADMEAMAVPEPPVEDADDEATRLRWRNRYLEGRVKYLEEELLTAQPALAAVEPPPAVSTAAALAALSASRTTHVSAPEGALAPPTLDGPRDGKADNLKEIAGIGPKLEKTLNGLGIWHFDQIAAWSQPEIDWVNAAISFKGRIEREKWVSQAADLARGVETDGKRKYLEGKHT